MFKVPFRFLLPALSAVVFVACGESEPVPTPTPAPTATATPVPTATPAPTPTAAAPVVELVDAPPAGEILQESFNAMREVGSFHFELEADVKPSSSAGGLIQEIPFTFSADYQAPDRVHGKLAVSLGFFSVEVEIITVGDTTYITDPETGEWTTGSGPFSVLPSPTEFTSEVVSALDDVTLVGQEVLDGTPVYRLRGVPPLTVFEGSGGISAQADFWIGVEDSLLRQIVAEGQISLEAMTGTFGVSGISGDATVTMTMTFAAYGVPVVIEAP